MLPSITASSSGHWNQDGSRRWQRAMRPSPSSRSQTRMSPRKPSTIAMPSRGAPALGSATSRIGPPGSRSRICSISARLCSTSWMRTQTRALTSPSVAHRHLEGERVIGRVAGDAARIEGAAGGAADIAAGAELPRQRRRRGCRSRRCGPAARRCGRRARPASGKRARISASSARRRVDRPACEVGARRRPARSRSHHQAMAEGGVGGAQHALAQDAAMGVHQGEGGSLQIAPMSPSGWRGAPARPSARAARCARGGAVDAERGLDRAAKASGIGDGAVAGHAAGELGGMRELGAGHQALDALVDVAQPFLQAHHRLAVGGEAEMPGLDDAGMDRTDRDLVQALALDRQEGIRSPAPASVCASPSGWRMPQRPWSSQGRGSGSALRRRGRTDRGSCAPAGSPADDGARPRGTRRPGRRG